MLFEFKSLLTKSGAGRTILKLRRKRIIFTQGNVADAVFYILDGGVQLTAVSAGGREAVIAILRRGDFFGQNCLVGQEQRSFSASVLMDCTIMRLEKDIVPLLIKRHPEFAARLMSFLLQRTIRMQDDLIDQRFNSGEKRLARVLLLLADFGKNGNSESIIPRLSQETLAEMIGTTRSRVNIFLNEFRRMGFIKYNGVMRVRSKLLQVLLRN